MAVPERYRAEAKRVLRVIKDRVLRGIAEKFLK